MPDASDPRGRGPTGWGEAFAALPQETPPADAWSRVAARLDARDAATAATPSPTVAQPAASVTATAARRHGRRRQRRDSRALGA